MTPKQFDRLAIEVFGAVLAPLGFTCHGSKYCTFHRKVSHEVYHIVLPDLGSRGTWYDVKVFPISPVLEPSFDTQFPDSLGIPSDVWSYLGDRGIGMDKQMFNCKTEENMRRRFELTVKPLLLTKAIPYLDGIRTVNDMLPLIKHSSFLCLAMHHVGRVDEARPLLLEERSRLAKLDQNNELIEKLLARVNQLLTDS